MKTTASHQPHFHSPGFPVVVFFFLLVVFLFSVRFSFAEISNIEGIYIERYTSTVPAEPSKTDYQIAEPLLLSETTIEDGDLIAFEIPGFNAYLSENRKPLREVRLILGNIELTEFPALIENTESDIVRFLFRKKDISAENQILLYKLPGHAEKKAMIGIKIDESTKLFYSSMATVHFKEFEHRGIFCWSSIALLVVVFLFVVLKFDKSLKDSYNYNPDGKEQYFCFSFSKTQFFFWTFIVIASFIYIWILSGDLASINDTALVLLGITTATISISNLISINEEKQATDEQGKIQLLNFRTKNPNDKTNFFQDILSDKNGISIHRLQAVIFNLIFGIAFFQHVLLHYSMPDFSPTQLVLLGLSSGTYAFLKTTESK